MPYFIGAQSDKDLKLEERGRALALISRKKDLEKRKQGKCLKVIAFPQGSIYVPAIRVSGLWLSHFGFELGDEVTLIARQNELIIRKEVSNK
jgi:hypothetical protein